MAKLKSNLKNMVIVLGLIAAVTSLILAYIFLVTKKPIDESKQKKLNSAIAIVVPGAVDIEEYTVDPAEGDEPLTFYDVKNDKGEPLGTAVQTYDNGGFNGRIVLLVGIDNDGHIIKTYALEQAETPGLGDKMSNEKSDFAKQFEGVNPAEFNFKVKKDKGDVDAITAATISSRAYCRAVQRAIDTYNKKKGDK